MIKQFLFKNFKNFKEVQISVEDMTILIGANAAGKSNAIEGIRILSMLARGRNVADIFINRGSDIRGSNREYARFGSETFTLGAVIDVDNDDYEYEIEISTDSEPVIVSEKVLKRSDNYVLKSQKNENISLLMKNDENDENTEKIYKSIVNSLARIFVYEFEPKNMRGYASIGDNVLRSDGANVSSVMFDLYPRYEQQILDIVGDLPENAIRSLSFGIGPMQDVALFAHEKYGRKGIMQKTSAAVISDGTLRCLGIIAAILSVPDGSMVIIEEPDNGINANRIGKLISKSASICKSKNIDLFFTTHNVSLLNGLNKEELVGVNVVYRDSEYGEGNIIPLLDIPELPVLLLNEKLGDLMYSNELSDYLRKVGLWEIVN